MRRGFFCTFARKLRMKAINRVYMKKILLLLSMGLLLMSTTGCVSSKKLRYFQGADSIYAEAQRIEQQYEMRLKPADQIFVKLSCDEPDLLDVFAQSKIMGSTSSGAFGGNVSTSLGTVNGFTIDNKGDVLLPVLGRVHVADLTMDECAEVIKVLVEEKAHIANPEVVVRLLNARVTVLGAIRSPGVISLTSERNTIVDIMAQCGDVDDTGLRYKVRLFRELNGKRQMYFVDLTKADVFKSPAYYVQQNDLIYVEPNKSKGVKASPIYTFMGAGSSILAAIMSVISFIYVFKK